MVKCIETDRGMNAKIEQNFGVRDLIPSPSAKHMVKMDLEVYLGSMCTAVLIC
jgi:hypothetical protein